MVLLSRKEVLKSKVLGKKEKKVKFKRKKLKLKIKKSKLWNYLLIKIGH